MLRKVLTVLVMAAGFSTAAQAIDFSGLMTDVTAKIVANSVHEQIAFKVGDEADYKLNMASFIQGTMKMTVKQSDSTALVIDQDMDLGQFGKQSCEETLNPSTGALKKLVCNGQDQSTADQGGQQVEQEKQDTITVPAGTFKCLYAKVKNTKDNSESELWLAPNQVPVGGMVKTLAPSQLGQVDVQLSSFHAN
jgi:hypothetical protein